MSSKKSTSRVRTSRPEQVGAVNRLLTEAAARPYVSTHDGQPPHLHYADENADVVTRVRAATAAGLAVVLTETDPCRLGRCSAPDCRAVFVDTSRNGRRAYCSHASAPPGSTCPRTATASGGRKAVHLDRANPPEFKEWRAGG